MDNPNPLRDDNQLFYPSPLAIVNIKGKDRVCPIWIPQNETFRVRSIIQEHEYGIPGLSDKNGSLAVWDIGANVGLFTLYMKLLYPEAAIHSFELAPPTLELLRHNVGSLAGVTVHPYGLFNRDGEISVNLHSRNTGENSVKMNGRDYGKSVPVPIKSAARVFDELGTTRLDVLKIDTEGCEVEILECLEERLKNIDYILVEYHSEGDRRRIDAVLGDFHLFGANANSIDRGTMKYVHTRLVPKL